MWRRRFLLILLLFSLVGCAADSRQVEFCRQAFAVLAGKALALAPPEGDGEGMVTLNGVGDDAGHRLVCRFAGRPLAEGHLDLLTVEYDGDVQPEIDMIMLRHVLGLAEPTAFLERPRGPTAPPAQQAAYFVQQILNGLSVGAMLALIAIGYSLVYGITGTIQFAYGEIFMVGAFLFLIPFYAFFVLGLTNIALAALLALPCTVIATGVYGWTMGRVIYRPLFRASRLNALIAAIGLGMALRELVRLTQGTKYKWMPPLFHRQFELFEAGGFSVYVSQTQLVTLAIAATFTLALAYLLMRTRWGRSYRACADDGIMASLLGIDIHGTIEVTLVLGAALAAVSGLCFTIHYGEADAYMGFVIGLKALTAVVLGGIGTVTGALAGSLTVGVFEALWAGYFGSAYKDTAVFSLLALVLIFRPEGLFGLSLGSEAASQPGLRRS
jgi:branched-chain amino acid transport system permease protein